METKTQIRAAVAAALNKIQAESESQNGPQKTQPILAEQLSLETPPDPKMGDVGVPLFSFAKIFRTNPAQIASRVERILKEEFFSESNSKSQNQIPPFEEIFCAGPYVNFRLNKTEEIFSVLKKIAEQKTEYGSFCEDGKKPLFKEKIAVEFSSPNTNKPLHLGHLRNDALGESVSRILKKAGAQVFKVNIINNRGIHICKSMLAYKMFHEKNCDTPSSLKMKGDHFVGQCYVEYDQHAKNHPQENLQEQAEKMLLAWEGGDEEVRLLWQKMNEWTLSGIKETYERTGVSFDKLYFESETYLKGKDEIQKGLERGIFFRAKDGSVRADVTQAVGKGKDGEAHEKVLLRADGTSVYITQDIGTAISRHEDFPFTQMIYVVATEQNFHFKTLFFILKKLGFPWAQKLFHLAYGLVNLPSGRMKSREGTVVDADDLLDNLRDAAFLEMQKKGRDKDLDDAEAVAEKVALAAVHYYLLQASPQKDMLFNPEESLSFNGNTGPYLQYMGARISSILKKAAEQGIAIFDDDDFSKEGENCEAEKNSNCKNSEKKNCGKKFSKEDAALLKSCEEWELAKILGAFPQAVERAAKNLDPSVIASWLYDAAKAFSKFYQNCPILAAKDERLAAARLHLAFCTLVAMKNAMDLVLVPFLERM